MFGLTFVCHFSFGLSGFGDGATVKKMPLATILCSELYLHTAVMEICATSQIENGGKKVCFASILMILRIAIQTVSIIVPLMEQPTLKKLVKN
jgi:hypothetical protein